MNKGFRGCGCAAFEREAMLETQFLSNTTQSKLRRPTDLKECVQKVIGQCQPDFRNSIP